MNYTVKAFQRGEVAPYATFDIPAISKAHALERTKIIVRLAMEININDLYFSVK